MTYLTRVSVWMVMSCLTLTTAFAEEPPALSFFDYLGTLVEGQDGWIDPLTLADEQAATTEDADTEVAPEPAVAPDAKEVLP